MTGSGRIAVMGGTFDPIHYGHLASAETVRAEFGFDKIIFVPSGSPPHKEQTAITDGQRRYHMTSIAVAPNERFDISRIELERKGPTYTIDTVREMRERYMADVFFITGADALHEIITWRDADKLLKLCAFIAITRPGYNNGALLEQSEYLKKEHGANIHFLEVPAVSISSSEIRGRVKAGRPIRYLLPDSVEKFIREQGLYV